MKVKIPQRVGFVIPAAAVALICAIAASSAGSRSSPAADSEPDFTLPQVRGGTFRLRSEPARPVLLGFLQTVPDTAHTPSRSQAVFLSSMARQYGPHGLRVVAIDASALVTHEPPDHDSLVNVSYDWQMNFPLLEDEGNHVAQRFGVAQVPTLVLLAPDGSISRRWQGLTRPAPLAQRVEKLLGGALGQLPSL